ncbi:hypothetical protein 2.7 [Burkholderia phage Bups phi1]|nr:hypothetical protein 2.7 [Burkholderia phage Bups phi1]
MAMPSAALLISISITFASAFGLPYAPDSRT